MTELKQITDKKNCVAMLLNIIKDMETYKKESLGITTNRVYYSPNRTPEQHKEHCKHLYDKAQERYLEALKTLNLLG